VRHRGVVPRAGAAALATCAWLAAAASPAPAAPTWLAPHTLSAGPSSGSAKVAVDAAGDAVAVWEQGEAVEASSRPAGGSWSAPAMLSAPGDKTISPQVAIAANGASVAVWDRVSGGEYFVEAATGSALTGAWSGHRAVSSTAGVAPSLVRVASDAAGDAEAVWLHAEASETAVEAASHAAGSGAWASAKTLSKGAEAMKLDIGEAADGYAVAVWEEKTGLGREIDAARRPAGGEAWLPKTGISAPAGNVNTPSVAVDARGDAVAIWERFTSFEEIESASLPAGAGTWTPPVTISSPVSTDEPGEQAVAIDGQGRAVAVWLRETLNRIEAVSQTSPGGAWSPQVVISEPAAVASEPALAVDAGGDAVAVWAATTGKQLLRSSSRPADSAVWGAPLTLPTEVPLGPEPSLGVDDQGDALASYVRYTGSAYETEADAYDVAGPVLNGLSIPAAAGVGQPLTFSASPLDVWSGLGPTSWSFGDGTAATGTSVTHAYAAPGTYPVSVTGADVLGNTTTATGSVTVTGPPPLPCSCAVPRPVISGLAQSHRRWREGSKLARLSRTRGAPVGTTFSFTLSRPATLTFTFTEKLPGRRVGRRCVAATHGNRSRRACTRTVTAGRLVLAGAAGARRLAFQGRVSRSKRLAPGSYTLQLTAVAGGLSSNLASLTFTIVR
jgi:hypothetical protein